MQAKVRVLGLDVHAATIAVAVAEADGSVHCLGTIANRAESIRGQSQQQPEQARRRTLVFPMRQA
jgi:hypothetical protein